MGRFRQRHDLLKDVRSISGGEAHGKQWREMVAKHEVVNKIDLQKKMVIQAMYESSIRTITALRKSGSKFSRVASKLRKFCKAYHLEVPACACTSKGG